MYQCHPKLNIPEEAINEIWNAMKKTIFKGMQSTVKSIEDNKNNKKWDLDKKYYPNWACIWNKPLNVNRTCSIMCKNSFIAIVHFEGDISTEDNILERVYRLEDLTLIRK